MYILLSILSILYPLRALTLRCACFLDPWFYYIHIDCAQGLHVHIFHRRGPLGGFGQLAFLGTSMVAIQTLRVEKTFWDILSHCALPLMMSSSHLFWINGHWEPGTMTCNGMHRGSLDQIKSLKIFWCFHADATCSTTDPPHTQDTKSVFPIWSKPCKITINYRLASSFYASVNCASNCKTKQATRT